jgi:hypothetical protein
MRATIALTAEDLSPQMQDEFVAPAARTARDPG